MVVVARMSRRMGMPVKLPACFSCSNGPTCWDTSACKVCRQTMCACVGGGEAVRCVGVIVAGGRGQGGGGGLGGGGVVDYRLACSVVEMPVKLPRHTWAPFKASTSRVAIALVLLQLLQQQAQCYSCCVLCCSM